MTDFKSLKKNSNMEKLTKALQATKRTFADDERYWRPTVDKAGNGFAVIRFLDESPADGDDAVPFVQYFRHSFQGPGGWFIENCPTTLGNSKCPACEYNSKLWKTGLESNKTIASAQKRKLTYLSNILVVKDPGNPENEGKVFLYTYGVKIFEKIQTKIEPTEAQLEQAKLEGLVLTKQNVFHLWKGLNFKLRQKKVKNFPNYDDSSFDETPTAVAETDVEIEKIWRSTYSLLAEKATDKFKSYEDLVNRFNKAIGVDGTGTNGKSAERASNEDGPPFEPDRVIKSAEPKKVTPAAVEEIATEGDDPDEMLAMFKKLAE